MLELEVRGASAQSRGRGASRELMARLLRPRVTCRARPISIASVVVLLGVLFSAAACRDASQPLEPTLIARVGGAEVYEREVRTSFERRRHLFETGELPANSKAALWRSCFEDVLQERLVAAAAREAHIVVLEDEVDGMLARLKRTQSTASSPINASASPSELREAARSYLLLGKYVAYQVATRVDITEDDLLAYADAHPEVLIRPARMRLRFLRLPNADHVTSLRQAVARGKAPADAAKEAWGRHVEVGDLGLVAVDRLPDEVRKRTERLAIRKLSDPLPLGDDVAVFWVSDRINSLKDAVPAARRRIERRLRLEREAAMEQQVLAELKQAAHVEVKNAAMPSDM